MAMMIFSERTTVFWHISTKKPIRICWRFEKIDRKQAKNPKKGKNSQI